MNKPNDFFSDDLSDLLGDGAAPAPRQLPQDEAFTRIRESGIGHVPVAKTFKINCQKCGGSGRFRSYNGRDVGPCFHCKGAGSFERKTAPAVLAKQVETRRALPGKRWDAFVADHPAQAAWIIAFLAKGNSDRFGELIADLKGKIERYGDLTEGQMGIIDRAIERDAARMTAKVENLAAQYDRRPTAPQYPKIRAFLLGAKEAGLKAPGFGGKGISLAMAKDHSRNPGCVYVTWKGEYAGKIGSDGALYLLRAFEGNAELLERLAAIEADPAAWTKLVGIETGSCACCGLELTDPVSVARGIGPICWGKWGF